MKYSDQFVEWLADEGYSHCFFVAGGNIMHLLDSARRHMECVPFVHEAAATIATEYFNEARPPDSGRAFALVTAGPGLTNAITGIAGAFLESRELLIVGGQVKSTDLSRGDVRQRGIQEVDGIALASPVTKATLRLEHPLPRSLVLETIRTAKRGRPGPVFVEFCLDAQAATPVLDEPQPDNENGTRRPTPAEVKEVADALRVATRPLLLIGGGLSRPAAQRLLPRWAELGIPVATTWNAADRIGYGSREFAGRPNTWGMRWANVVLQQADLIIALGTRLGLQQTGFNWEAFSPVGRVVQVDIDEAELSKGHPHIAIAICADAGATLEALLDEARSGTAPLPDLRSWLAFVRHVQEALPLSDPGNSHDPKYIDAFDLVDALSSWAGESDVIVPCSSGGAFTVMMQAFQQRAGQCIVTDKGLASMGYGLSGAIGAALANRGRRTILVEGDGGFAQNLQELGTLAAQALNLKVFILANDGYASIRMTQRNYFGGAYLGCDASTGLGLPDWTTLGRAYGIPTASLGATQYLNDEAAALFASDGPALFVVPIDPEQTFFPKINSRVTATGGMQSAPLHDMHPSLPDDVRRDLLRHLPGD